MAIRLRDVTLRQLRALSAIAGSGGVTTAARALNLTQPAVTLQLSLQDHAELPLLQRTADGMAADRGRARDAGQWRTASSGDRRLRGIARADGGADRRPRLVGAVSTAKYFAPFVIGAFAAPSKIEIVLTIANRQALDRRAAGL